MCASAMGAKIIIDLIKLIVREKEILRCYCIGNKTPLVVEKVFFFQCPAMGLGSSNDTALEII